MNQNGYIVICPTVTTPDHLWAQKEEVSNIYRLIEWAARRYRVDFRRLAVSGGSMGGVGSWSFALFRPDAFHAMAPVAGSGLALKHNTLTRLRGMPIYILHGAADPKAPVEAARQSAAELTRLKIPFVYVEVPGMGHQATPSENRKLMDWLIEQEPKPFSPHPLFLPAPDNTATPGTPVKQLWQKHADPIGLKDKDKLLDLIREGKTSEARKEITRQMRKTPGHARLLVLRAATYLPALLKEFPTTFRLADFRAEDGWATKSETAAIVDLKKALAARRGKDSMPLRFSIEVRLMLSRIYAKRTLIAHKRGDPKWVNLYNLFVAQINTIPADRNRRQ